MGLKSVVQKAYRKYRALPVRKQILYATIFILWQTVLLVFAIFSNRLQRNLRPLALRMDMMPGSWAILGLLIALVSIPPLFGGELLAIIAGYVYGLKFGFMILSIFSFIGESVVYFAFRLWFKSYLETFRQKHHKNYGVFVAVVEDGGVTMLWLIRMSVIPPHFSTPLFASLNNITWWKWMFANLNAAPIKYFPPVFIGTLLRDKRNNNIIGDLVFALSSIVTLAVMWYIYRQFVLKKAELAQLAGPDMELQTHAPPTLDERELEKGAGAAVVEETAAAPAYEMQRVSVDVTEQRPRAWAQ